jgi:hypothetical protein
MTLTAKILADITECCRRVGPTFATCWRQTKMSVVWVVELTDTNPDIASQGLETNEMRKKWADGEDFEEMIGMFKRGSI